jgi:hypothetical protein
MAIRTFFNYNFDILHNQEHQIGRMIETIIKIPKNKTITIWCGNNAHDQMGLRFAIYLLRNQEQQIHMMNVSEAYKEIVTCLAEEVPYAQGLISLDIFREIVKRYEYTMPLNPSNRKRYESEWLELSEQEHMLHLWQNGQIKGVAEEELDSMILAAVYKLQEEEESKGGFVRAGRVTAEMFENLHQLVGDQFIEYRLWRLISDGILGFKGLPGALYTFSVRLM